MYLLRSAVVKMYSMRGDTNDGTDEQHSQCRKEMFERETNKEGWSPLFCDCDKIEYGHCQLFLAFSPNNAFDWSEH